MFKEKLIQKLAEQNITRNSLAEKAGINQSSFSRIMTGDIKNPGVHTVGKIAKELNCSIDELIGRKVKGAKHEEDNQGPEKLTFDPKLAFGGAQIVFFPKSTTICIRLPFIPTNLVCVLAPFS